MLDLSHLSLRSMIYPIVCLIPCAAPPIRPPRQPYDPVFLPAVAARLTPPVSPPRLIRPAGPVPHPDRWGSLRFEE